MSSPKIVAAGVLLVTAAVYFTTLDFSFVYDDHLQIVASPAVHSWRYLPSYFTSHVWADAQPGSHSSYYRPLFLVWLLVNYTLFGLNPVWWHLSTLLVHLAATLLLYLMAVRLTGDRMAAAIAALIFGIHPVHIEPVAWVSAVTEPLLGVLLLGAFLCYPHRRGISLVLFAAALLDKETAVVFPAVILAWELLSRSKLRPALLATMPYAGLTAAYLAIRAAALHGLALAIAPLPLSAVATTLPSVISFYLRHLVWPAGLSFFYDVAYVFRPGLWNFALPAAIAAAAGALLLWCARQSRAAAISCVWLLVPLLPVLWLRGFIPEALVHDRYLYVPSMGFAILLAMAIRRFAPKAQAAIVIAALGGMAWGTTAQIGHWQNDLALFRRAVSEAPNNPLAKHALGVELGRLGLYREAIPLMRASVEHSPRSFAANATIGMFYYHVSDYRDAEFYLARAVKLRPNISRVPYAYLGYAQMEQGRLDSAEEVIRRGLTIEPLDHDETLIHGALGAVLKRKGELRAALEEFRAEAANNPRAAGVRSELAAIQAELNQNQ